MSAAERIAVVERAAALDERTQVHVASQQKLESERQRVHDWHQPVLECLDFQVQWANEVNKGSEEKTVSY